jgi:CubicO group peptidase (beta-lactamase class C family)
VESAGLSEGKMQNDVPVNVDGILQLILGRGGERFGMVAAVLRGEQIIAQGAAGLRKKGAVERITLKHRFHLGSCTKAMTATLVAMLVEEGKLNWTMTLGELFADTVKPMHGAWEKVTLRQVLAHRAGLRHEPGGLAQIFGELMGRSVRARLGTVPQQRMEIVREALARPPEITPDSKYWYSNVGYILAGAVLEQITGRAWEDLMRERLFQPLGISTGGFAAELPMVFYGPAGLARMTVTDWAKFIALHLRGDPANPQCQAALLKPDTFAELHAVAATAPYSNGWVMRGITRVATGEAVPEVAYRAGWFISRARWAKGTQPEDTGRTLWHGGRLGRSHSVVLIAPEIDFAVLVACNHGIAVWKTRQAIRALIRTFAPKATS